MSFQHRAVAANLAVALTAGLTGPAPAGPGVPSHAQVQTALARQLTAQLLPPLERVAAGSALALLQAGKHDLTQQVADSVAAALTGRGVEVWIAPGDSTELESDLASGWVLELGLDQARFEVGAPTRGFLVFGDGRCRRQAAARMTASLRSALGQPPVWSGVPAAVYADVIPAGQVAALDASVPAWIAEALKSAPKEPVAKSSWLERAAVLGLIGGVVIIYSAGAN